MRKILVALGLACFATIVLIVTIHAMGNLPIKSADCAAGNVVRTTSGTCECEKRFVWDESKSRCVLGSLWCRKNFAKGSSYLSAQNECACREGFALNASGDACVKVKPAASESVSDPRRDNP